MEISTVHNLYNGKQIFQLTILDDELVTLKLYPCDNLLLKKCELSNKISDKLLALERIAMRIEESGR